MPFPRAILIRPPSAEGEITLTDGSEGMAQQVLATARNVRMVLEEFRPRLESAGWRSSFRDR